MAIKIKSDKKDSGSKPTPTTKTLHFEDLPEEEAKKKTSSDFFEQLRERQDEFEIHSPMKAIKQNCIECSGGSAYEAKLCTCTSCPLYPFRFGRNPFHKRSNTMTDEQKKEVAERLRKGRAQ